jgi:YHS domain-containing protein
MNNLGGILWLLAIGWFFFYVMRRGGAGCCGGHNHSRKDNPNNTVEHGTHQHNDSAHFQHYENDRDPVCGMGVKKEDQAFLSTHMGRTIRFCSDRCRNLFELNPNKYAAGSIQPAYIHVDSKTNNKN